jgi:hypothetical protein
VQHLYDTSKERGSEVTFGPWQCDNCQYEFRGTVLYSPGNIYDPCVVTITDVHPWGKVPKLSLLRLRDLYLVVDGYGDYRPEEQDRLWYDFLFHSHQCPTNILRSVVEVYDKDGFDPHGIMRFVAALDDTKENRKMLDEAGTSEALFQLFQTDGQDALTMWPEKDKGVIPWIAAMQRGEGIPPGALTPVVVSTEEEAIQGIVKVEILSTISADEAHKKVIEYVEQALREVLGKKEDA